MAIDFPWLQQVSWLESAPVKITYHTPDNFMAAGFGKGKSPRESHDRLTGRAKIPHSPPGLNTTEQGGAGTGNKPAAFHTTGSGPSISLTVDRG